VVYCGCVVVGAVAGLVALAVVAFAVSELCDNNLISI